MNVQIKPANAARRAAGEKLAIADCDIHPSYGDGTALAPFLDRRWRDHIATFGTTTRTGFQFGPPYPKGQPGAFRRDATPTQGGTPGSDLVFMQEQYLDPSNVTLGILNPISPAGGIMNPDLAIAMCRAVNEWQVHSWTARDQRLKASVVVPYENAPAAAAEIDHWAGNPNFAQVILLSRTAEPLGNRRYWPLYEAAARASLPVAVHAFGYGGYPITSAGWPSFYIEEMVGHAQSCQSLLTSMVIEGVFETFPTLRVVLVEAGFTWLPSLAWRMDSAWKRLRAEVPHLRRKPSEVLREQVWLTTQPIDEPREGAHLLETMDWIGWDRLLFASDYPHWDFDDPSRALSVRLDEGHERQLFLGNAKALYRLA